MNDISPELAELYDLDCSEFGEDISYYRALAFGCDGPLLELGVGTGRVAVPLAAEGFDVWGIDASPAMLARATCQARAQSLSTLRLIEGRMENFDLEQRFGLIYAAFGTLHLLLTLDALQSCLRSVARHLSPGGVFACDLRPLHFEDWEEGDSFPLFHDWTRPHPSTGETVMKFRTVRNDPEYSTKTETALFDIVTKDALVKRVVHEASLRYFARDELEEAIRRSGLRVDGVYGGYGGEPYRDDGDHMIVVARRL